MIKLFCVDGLSVSGDKMIIEIWVSLSQLIHYDLDIIPNQPTVHE